MIDVQNLCKDYMLKVKAPGLRGALRGLLRPEYKIIHAVKDLSFHIDAGEIVGFIGPNGAGKSTLIRAIAQTVPWEGSLRLDGENLREMKSMKRARLIGVLAQHNRAQYGYTVEEIVRLGRYAYRQGFLKGGGEDTEQAVSRTGLITGTPDQHPWSGRLFRESVLHRKAEFCHFLRRTSENPSALAWEPP